MPFPRNSICPALLSTAESPLNSGPFWATLSLYCKSALSLPVMLWAQFPPPGQATLVTMSTSITWMVQALTKLVAAPRPCGGALRHCTWGAVPQVPQLKAHLMT